MKRSESKTANAVRAQLILSLTLGKLYFLGMFVLSLAGTALAFGALLHSAYIVILALLLNAALLTAALWGLSEFHKTLKKVKR